MMKEDAKEVEEEAKANLLQRHHYCPNSNGVALTWMEMLSKLIVREEEIF